MLPIHETGIEPGARFRYIMSRWQGKEKSTSTSNLSGLIEDFGDCKCSDPRDRVYGLLALLKKSSDLGETQMLPVNYSMPLEMVFFEVLKFCKASDPATFNIRLMKVLELDKRYEIERK
jgi:hypothetical protein